MEFGFALTPGCPKALWEQWLSDNKANPMVVNGLIYIRGQGIVVNEPSVVAIKEDKIRGQKTIAAIGADVYTQGSKSVGSVLISRMKLAGPQD